MKTKMITTLVGVVACVMVGSVFADVYMYDPAADPLTSTAYIVGDTTDAVVHGAGYLVTGATDAVVDPVVDVLS